MSEVSILNELNYTTYLGAAEIYFRICKKFHKQGKKPPSVKELSVKKITSTLKNLEESGKVKRRDGYPSDMGEIPKWKLVKERSRLPLPQKSNVLREQRH